MNNPIYSQRDPRWADQKLGKSESTIGDFGCTVSAIGMLFDKTPEAMNLWLKSNDGFTRDLVWWAKVPYFVERFYCEKTVAPVERIREELRAGHAVLLAVHLGKDTNAYKVNHWVLCIDENFTINDPWFGDRVLLADRYGNPEKAILGGAFFNYPPLDGSPVDNSLHYPHWVEATAKIRVRKEPNTNSVVYRLINNQEVFTVIGEIVGETINNDSTWLDTGNGYITRAYTRERTK